jgi:formylglycine-generating enzyme required for sulfatase activity
MKTKLRIFCAGLALLAGIHSAAAQSARFFRISGPAATKITAFRADGSLVWSNALAGTNYIVQTATTLQGGTNWVNYVQLPVTQSINTNQIIAPNPPAGMVLIPAGSFTIGNSIGDSDITDANPANVYVSAFYMDVNLVTYGNWTAVYAYATNHNYAFTDQGSGMGANHPVQSVSWWDCVKWCNARSQQAGLTPAYYTDAGFTLIYTNGNISAIFANWTANGYRLPTEAEWEKAARGGLSGNRFPWGNTITESQANYNAAPATYSYDLGPYSGENTNINIGFPNTTPVGSFAPNGYGLFDMAGNVEEWCWDWYWPSPYTSGSPYLGGTDPRGSASAQYNARIWRGGNWSRYATSARCANRDAAFPGYAGNGFSGFRCVKEF